MTRLRRFRTLLPLRQSWMSRPETIIPYAKIPFIRLNPRRIRGNLPGLRIPGEVARESTMMSPTIPI